MPKRIVGPTQSPRPTGSSNFDLAYRPATYFGLQDKWVEFVTRIKGAERKRRAKQLIEAGRFNDLEGWMLAEALPEADRRAFGRIHPRNMGGEYTPDFLKGEVEIARVTMASSTQDVISIRARRSGKRIAYRIVDEYAEFGPFRHHPLTSTLPLTLEQLATMIETAQRSDESAGLVTGLLRWQLDCGVDLNTYENFFDVTSEYYPQLHAFFQQVVANFIAEWRATGSGSSFPAGRPESRREPSGRFQVPRSRVARSRNLEVSSKFLASPIAGGSPNDAR